MNAENLFSTLGGSASGVAYMLPSLIETYATLWGAETAGYAVPINFLLQTDSIAELIKASEAKILVALGPHPQLDIWEKALELRNQIPGLILIRVAPAATPAEEGVIDLGTALAQQPDDHLIFGEPRGASDVAAYFHTGGTTGVPELVAHTHRSQLVSALCGYTCEDVMTATLPLFHVAGTMVAGLSAFMAGIDPLSVAGSVGSVGWALPYSLVEILRLNEDGGLGDPCAMDEIGVITIQGDHVSPGCRDPKHNDGAFDAGRLNSGDLGYKDAQGRIYVAGRSKYLIIRSGHNIDPTMIENAIATHPAVALAAAVGMPDAYAEELPVCFVELRPGAEVRLEDLHQHAQRMIDERPAWPNLIQVVDAIPLTSVGKIFKPSLRCEIAKQKVLDMVQNELKIADAHVEVVAGGTRGMRVTVTLSKGNKPSQAKLETALADFLFEARVHVG